MALTQGFEPWTYWLTANCSNHLSYVSFERFWISKDNRKPRPVYLAPFLKNRENKKTLVTPSIKDR